MAVVEASEVSDLDVNGKRKEKEKKKKNEKQQKQTKKIENQQKLTKKNENQQKLTKNKENESLVGAASLPFFPNGIICFLQCNKKYLKVKCLKYLFLKVKIWGTVGAA